MARLTVKQIATLSGISVRTLHYYDQIGLLKPCDIGANGYRYYDRSEMLRLQQILFYRQLEMPLSEIKATLDAADFNLLAALTVHRQRLVGELERHRRLIQTIDETLNELNGDRIMKNPFVGFSPEKQKAYEKELIEQGGDDMQNHVAEANRNVGKMSPAQHAAIKAEGHEVNIALVARIEAGDSHGADVVQALIERHHGWVSNYWVPNQQAYIGLGQQYVDHPDFRAFYDKYDDRLVEFLAASMKIYAEVNLD